MIKISLEQAIAGKIYADFKYLYLLKNIKGVSTISNTKSQLITQKLLSIAARNSKHVLFCTRYPNQKFFNPKPVPEDFCTRGNPINDTYSRVVTRPHFPA